MVNTRFLVDLTDADDEEMGDFILALAEGLLEHDHVLLDGIEYLACSRTLLPLPGHPR
ncbi:MAG: hypothetical protein V3S01_09310 [Dehalococcoidia bacterium]